MQCKIRARDEGLRTLSSRSICMILSSAVSRCSSATDKDSSKSVILLSVRHIMSNDLTHGV